MVYNAVVRTPNPDMPGLKIEYRSKNQTCSIRISAMNNDQQIPLEET